MNWLKNSSDYFSTFLFLFNLFVLLEIIIARSYLSPFIWLSFSSAYILLKNENYIESSNED